MRRPVFVLCSDLSSIMSPPAPAPSDFLDRVAQRTKSAGVFASVERSEKGLQCAALGTAAPAWYRLDVQSGQPWISLVTPDRYLSQSIELDLVHTGDKLEDLLEEELVDLGFDAGTLRFEHFRSEDKLFTFRSKLPLDPSALSTPTAADTAAICLLAYEACFRRLGDMASNEDDV